jgi:hypothetical protein
MDAWPSYEEGSVNGLDGWAPGATSMTMLTDDSPGAALAAPAAAAEAWRPAVSEAGVYDQGADRGQHDDGDEEPAVPALEPWLEDLAAPAPAVGAKRRRTAPVVDATCLPPDSVRAQVAARQAEKIEALRRDQSARGEAPLELPAPRASEGDGDEGAIEREETRIGDDEAKFMATLKRIRQEERGIVNLPDKLKEVLKAQRTALTSKYSVSSAPPPSPLPGTEVAADAVGDDETEGVTASPHDGDDLEAEAAPVQVKLRAPRCSYS